MSIVRFHEQVPVPWKNGLGVTREIATSPAGASTDDFLWRVSIAEVDTAAPFSRFPGVDRTIVLLDGDGFTMTFDDGRRHALTTPLQPFAFAGEAGVGIALAGGATRDFNLMARRGRVQAQIAVMQVGGDASGLPLPTDCTLAYVARGRLRMRDQRLDAGDAWLGTGPMQADGPATLLIVTIRGL